MLMPAAVLILIILGSIAVDSAIAFLGQRELNSFVTEAADRAAAAAVAPASFYQGGRVVIDPRQAQDIAAELQAHLGAGLHDVRVNLTTDGPTVQVRAVGIVDSVFSRAIPGARHSWEVHATATATAREVLGLAAPPSS